MRKHSVGLMPAPRFKGVLASRDYTGGFMVTLMQKDRGLVTEAALACKAYSAAICSRVSG